MGPPSDFSYRGHSPVPVNRLQRDLERLSLHYPLWLDDDYRFVVVQSVTLPLGYNRSAVDFLVGLPKDYPLSPPGLGDSSIYTSPNLQFRGRDLLDLHGFANPTYGLSSPRDWAWFCYEEIDWDPVSDNLIKFMEMVRADLTNPRTA